MGRKSRSVTRGSMKGHVKSKLQLWQLAKYSFMDSVPLLRRELPVSPG